MIHHGNANSVVSQLDSHAVVATIVRNHDQLTTALNPLPRELCLLRSRCLTLLQLTCRLIHLRSERLLGAPHVGDLVASASVSGTVNLLARWTLWSNSSHAVAVEWMSVLLVFDTDIAVTVGLV